MSYVTGSNYWIAEAIRSLPEDAVITLRRRTLYGNDTIGKLYGLKAASQFMKWRQERPRACTYDIEVKVKACSSEDLDKILFLKKEEFENPDLIVVDIVNKDGSVEGLMTKREEEMSTEAERAEMDSDSAIQTLRTILIDILGGANNDKNEFTGNADLKGAKFQAEGIDLKYIQHIEIGGPPNTPIKTFWRVAKSIDWVHIEDVGVAGPDDHEALSNDLCTSTRKVPSRLDEGLIAIHSARDVCRQMIHLEITPVINTHLNREPGALINENDAPGEALPSLKSVRNEEEERVKLNDISNTNTQENIAGEYKQDDAEMMAGEYKTHMVDGELIGGRGEAQLSGLIEGWLDHQSRQFSEGA